MLDLAKHLGKIAWTYTRLLLDAIDDIFWDDDDDDDDDGFLQFNTMRFA